MNQRLGDNSITGQEVMDVLETGIASAFPVACCGHGERTTKNIPLPCVENSLDHSPGNFPYTFGPGGFNSWDLIFMARMHPEDIDDLENATPGERTVLDFSGKRPGRFGFYRLA